MKKKTLAQKHPHLINFASDLAENEINRLKNPFVKNLASTALDEGKNLLIQDGLNPIKKLEQEHKMKQEEKKREKELAKQNKKKKHCKEVTLFLLTAAAVKESFTLFDAIRFKRNLDKSDESLDSCVICAKEEFSYPMSPMQDFKIGCFLGNVTVDLRDVVAEKKQYDLEIKADQATVKVLLPQGWHLHITSKLMCGKVENKIHKIDAHEDGVLLTVYADVNCAKVVFEN